MKNGKRTHWFRNTLLVLVACGVVGAIWAAVIYFGDTKDAVASATLELTFDGAAEGKAPNGYAYDVNEMASDEILTEALKASSLDGKYTPDQIRDCLVITGSYPEDIVSQVLSYESLMNFTVNREVTIDDYYPTLFSVSLSDAFDRKISGNVLSELLGNILSSYQAYFARVYSFGIDQGISFFTLEDYDFPQQLEILEESYSLMASYAKELYETDPTFRVGGNGFNDIAVRLNNLNENDLARLVANVTMNALTRNTARLLTEYQFEIRDLGIELEKQQESEANLQALIDSYEKNEIIYLSTSDALTKIDGNSSETYDELITRQKEVSDEIIAINSSIAEYQKKVTDILGNTQEDTDAKPASGSASTASKSTAVSDSEEIEVPEEVTADEIVEMTEEELAEAAEAAEEAERRQVQILERDIQAVQAKGDEIISLFAEMIQTYNDQEINEGTVAVSHQKYKAPTLLSGAYIKTVIKTAGPLCALGFMVCLVLLIISRKRERQ